MDGLSLSHLAGTPWLAVVVFLAEVCVVTICTLRIIFVSRGMKVLAAVLGFFEITLWLLAIGQVMQNLHDFGCFAGFAAGFTLGNYLGVLIEKKLAMGISVVRIITDKDTAELVQELKQADFGVTCVDGRGTSGPVQVVLTLVKRRRLDDVITIVKKFDPKAFFSVEQIQTAEQGYFRGTRRRSHHMLPFLPPRMRTSEAA